MPKTCPGAQHVPGDASGAFCDQCTEGGKHRPSAVDQLIFSEAAQAKHLVIGGKGILADSARLHWGSKGAKDIACFVYCLVLVLLVGAELHPMAECHTAPYVNGPGRARPRLSGGFAYSHTASHSNK